MQTAMRLALALRALANKLDPPVAAHVIACTVTADNADDACVNEVILRHALFAALHRYSPMLPHAQA